MTNPNNATEKLITMRQAKKLLIVDLKEVLGVEVDENGAYGKCLNVFCDFMEQKEVFNFCALDDKVLGEFRMFLNNSQYRVIDQSVINAVGSLLLMGMSKRYIPAWLYEFWGDISDLEKFIEKMTTELGKM